MPRGSKFRVPLKGLYLCKRDCFRPSEFGSRINVRPPDYNLRAESQPCSGRYVYSCSISVQHEDGLQSS